ncbi:hypothetical protein L1S35_05285 [Flavobacterium sp. AS60]|uniref:hypothetical protein n=1 Tax=Flavobacterium anseongense TaxID=2910677 RepID=UPI001F3E2F76|nr:hypothetical protein [Flavobacterium sp. AS60]MCF6129078.1 hypothetical protein [Flavobacterium sp. AS60]
MKNLCLTFLISTIILSCTEKKKSAQSNELKKLPEINFEFPDTIHKNISYKGKIYYSGIFDTITKNVMEKKNGIDRYIIFSLTKSSHPNENIAALRKMKLDTFGAIDNNAILLDNIIFKELGVFYINGILNDHVTIDTKRSDKKIRYIEKEYILNHKIVVIQ